MVQQEFKEIKLSNLVRETFGFEAYQHVATRIESKFSILNNPFVRKIRGSLAALTEFVLPGTVATWIKPNPHIKGNSALESEETTACLCLDMATNVVTFGVYVGTVLSKSDPNLIIGATLATKTVLNGGMHLLVDLTR